MDRGLKIVLTINNKLALDLTKGSLSFLGFENVLAVHDPLTAAEALLRDKGGILISDYRNLLGEEASLLQAVKARPELGNVKTIVLAAEDELDVNKLKQWYNEGVSSVIPYPFQMNDLQKALSDAVRSVPSQMSDTFTKVRQLDFFSFMTDEDILRLLKITKCRRYQKDETIFEEGQPGDRFYVIVEGSVSILRALGQKKEELLTRLEKGACFGEMAILDNTTRSAGAKADSDVVLFELDSRIMEGYDDVLTLKLFKKLVHVFSDRLRKADQKIKELLRME